MNIVMTEEEAKKAREELIARKLKLYGASYRWMIRYGDLRDAQAQAAKIKAICTVNPETMLIGECKILEALHLHYNFYGNWRPALDRIVGPEWSSLSEPYKIKAGDLFTRINESARRTIALYAKK